MSELIAYKREVTNVFQLIGMLENDITKSIAWALCQCPEFMKRVISELLNIEIDPNKVRIVYQEFEKDKGITDLEITDDDLFYIIIEAKRGWILPGEEQLTMYSERKSISQSRARYKAIVSMSECSNEYAKTYLPLKEVGGIPILHLSWKRIYEIADESRVNSSNAQKNLLIELKEYLGGIMTMQSKDSNWVYVVSVGTDHPKNCKLTWIDFVEKRGRYFHPVGGGKKRWPKTPPNYIGFRYYGQLQSIHYIEGYDVTRNLHEIFPEMPDEECNDNHFVYKLGPAIKPNHVVKTGNIYASGRVWTMLDTLLTSETVSQARDISKARQDGIAHDGSL